MALFPNVSEHWIPHCRGRNMSQTVRWHRTGNIRCSWLCI